MSDLVSITAQKLPRRWLSLWNEVEIEEVERFGPSAVELDRTTEKKINIYRNAFQLDGRKSASELLLGEFFKLVEFQLAPDLARRFEYKFAVADPSTVTGFNERLKTGTFKSYKDIVYDFGSAVERLTALHLANALLVNNLPIGEARDVDVTSWTSTKDFANGRRYCSLRPLISAYSPRDVEEDFSVAAAAYLDNGLEAVQESSTKAAYVKLLKSIVG